MRVRPTMEHRLTAALAPSRLEIVDESHRHAGHGGADPRGESHFRIEIVSPAFIGKSRVERQRAVYGALGDLIPGRIHALSLTTRTPDEDATARNG